MVRVSVEGIKSGLYVNTVAQTKTFDMNTEAAMFPDEFYSFVKELQEQLAEGKIDRILIKTALILFSCISSRARSRPAQPDKLSKRPYTW